ncbi:MAG: Mut7-C RNAse domain-containing protein [bacterium]
MDRSVVEEPEKPASTKLIVDFMCGKLARWLRVLGVDTEYYNETDSANLLKRALSEERTVITRNTRISPIPNVEFLVLRSELPDEQIRQVIKDLHLQDRLAVFTRCNVCNGELMDMKKNVARGKVPFYVFQTQDKFKMCPRCGRIYWEGTHIHSMKAYIRRLLEEDN